MLLGGGVWLTRKRHHLTSLPRTILRPSLICTAVWGMTAAMTRMGFVVLVGLLLVVGRAGSASARTRCTTDQDCTMVSADLACGLNGFCGLADGQKCDANSECASGFCQFPLVDPPAGTCVERNPAPAASTHTTILMGTGLLLAGMWSVRRVARRR